MIVVDIDQDSSPEDGPTRRPQPEDAAEPRRPRRRGLLVAGVVVVGLVAGSMALADRREDVRSTPMEIACELGTNGVGRHLGQVSLRYVSAEEVMMRSRPGGRAEGLHLRWTRSSAEVEREAIEVHVIGSDVERTERAVRQEIVGGELVVDEGAAAGTDGASVELDDRTLRVHLPSSFLAGLGDQQEFTIDVEVDGVRSSYCSGSG